MARVNIPRKVVCTSHRRVEPFKKTMALVTKVKIAAAPEEVKAVIVKFTCSVIGTLVGILSQFR